MCSRPPPKKYETNRVPLRYMSSMTSDFTYQNVPLPNPSYYIRLLHLHPPSPLVPGDAFSSPLHCSISVCPIDQPTPYHAISYTWGPPNNERHYLQVHHHNNPDSPSQQLPITTSLDTALRHLRQLASGKVATLWIDQICISQAENAWDEKSKQVGIMHRIYSSAEQVRVWLGPAENGSNEVMEMWEEVGRKCEQEVNLASYFSSNLSAIHTLIDHVNNRTPDDPVTQRIQRYMDWAAPRMKPYLKGMTVMFSRPWFRRVWVIQEFALAANTVFVCGLKVIQAQYPAWVLNMYSHCRSRIWPGDLTEEDFEVSDKLWNPAFDTLFTIRKRRQDHDNAVKRGLLGKNESPPPGPGAGDYLFDLLVKTSSDQRMEATDLRDRIYALLGVAVDREKLERLGLKPNYQRRKFEEVLLATARAIILRGEVQILSFSQFPKQHTLPSWVPEWRPGLATPYFHYSNRSLGRLPPMFTASGSSKPAVIQMDNPAIIGLRGCRIDIVEDTSDPWTQTEWDISNNSSYLTFLRQVQALCDRSAVKEQNIYPSEPRRTEAFWRVPVADCEISPNGLARATTAQSAEMYAYCLESCELFESASPSQWDSKTAARHEELRPGSVYFTCLGRTANKRPFLTERGHVGLGPLSTRAGDIVVIFSGAPIVYLVRPTAREGHFEFLGDGYCDGVMDGEAWDETKAETFFLV